MTQNEIDFVLKSESGMILLSKKSSHSLIEHFFSNWTSLFSALYFGTRNKMDILILTEKRFIYLIKNKIYIEIGLKGIGSLNYDGNKSVLEITAEKEKYSIPLDKLEINQEESNLLRQNLSNFVKQKNELQ